ncbi:hypothetical protein [Rhodococcus yananensis]|uniref:hypothetical protein n=1 Tax=Rhodococcus yananensis TaxID=2879464 RepID=UPI003EBAB514
MTERSAEVPREEHTGAAYRRVTAALGEFAHTTDLTGHDEFPGLLLTDPEWLADRVADTGRRWGCDDARVNGTLWWYSASSTLVAAPLAMLLTDGLAPDPDLTQLRCALRENGYLAAVRSSRLLRIGDYSTALVAAHDAMISALAAVSGAAPRALWAIAADSIAGRALTAGRALGRIGDGCALAESVTVAPMPTPRYVDIEGADRGERFVRRCSCCLIYTATGGDKCSACPRRTPAERHARLLERVVGAHSCGG